MKTVLQFYVSGEQYYTRSNISQYYPITYVNTQRFVERHKDTIKTHIEGKVIYYRKKDIDFIFERKQKIKELIEEVVVKNRVAQQVLDFN